MKSFVGACILVVSCITANAQSGQSPLAPPKVPAPSASGTSLKLGAKAPDFALPNGDGKLVVLSEYTQRSPVVLVFYRGFWWGACTQQLTRLAEDYGKIKQAGGELIAISVDEQSFAWSMAQTTGAKFQILSDAEKKTITEYGIVNAAEHGGIAHPSIFVLDKEGRIRYMHVGKDAQDRPPDETILEEVKKVVAAK
jgi:peroxiredoxin